MPPTGYAAVRDMKFISLFPAAVVVSRLLQSVNVVLNRSAKVRCRVIPARACEIHEKPDNGDLALRRLRSCFNGGFMMLDNPYSILMVFACDVQ